MIIMESRPLVSTPPHHNHYELVMNRPGLPQPFGHRVIPVNSAVAFPPVCSSSSSSSSGTHSNPPSVPTTPESQSSERLATIARSQPDLSKLEELEIYLARTNIGGNNSMN